MLAIKSSLIALASAVLLVQAVPTSDVAYETEDGRLEHFHVEDEATSPAPGTIDVAYETEDGRRDYFQILDQTNETALADFEQLLAFDFSDNARAADPGIYKCGGSSQCGTFPKLAKYCDHAKAWLDGSRTYASVDGYLGGNCWGNSVGLGCGVMVDPNVRGCYRTGAVMQGAYDHIRNAGCPRCGSVQDDDNRGDACRIKIDYVSKCGNRASGVGP